MFERFAERARDAIVLAREEAQRFRHNYLGTEHLLLGLARETEGVAARVFSHSKVDPEEIRREVLRRIGDPGRPPRGKTRRAYLGIESAAGGDRRKDLRAMRTILGALEAGSLLRVLAKSGVYETASTDAQREDRTLLSCVLEVQCRMSASELLCYCQGIEAALAYVGEGNEEKETPAKVYLLMHEREVVKEAHLCLPHPRARHAHHLKALAQIAPDLAVPAVTVKDLLASADVGDVSEIDEGI